MEDESEGMSTERRGGRSGKHRYDCESKTDMKDEDGQNKVLNEFQVLSVCENYLC